MMQWIRSWWDWLLGRRPPLRDIPTEEWAERMTKQMDYDAFMQQYQGVLPVFPRPGDGVFIVRGGHVLHGALLAYVDGGCEVEVPDRGVMWVRAIFPTYDDAFGCVLDQKLRANEPEGRPTKAPHLRIISNGRKEGEK